MHRIRKRRFDRTQATEIIATIEESDGCTRKELQLECHMGQTEILRLLNKMQKRDWIETEKHPEDKRKTVYTKA